MSQPADVSSEAAVSKLLEMLPTFEDPAFVPASWPPRFHIDEHGTRHDHFPYPDYHPLVEEFRTVVTRFVNGIHPYRALPEDDSKEDIPFNVMGTSFPLEYFETATRDQLRRYFMLMARGERFADGHIDGEFRNGKVVAALRRLSALRAAGEV